MKFLDYSKKIVLVGDAAVGKTSLIRRFVIDKFDDKYIVTIGTKTSRKQMEFKYEPQQLAITLTLNIWDIIGQKEMKKLHTLYFKGSEGVIVVCDMTRADTLASVPEWLNGVYECCGKVPAVLACNKSDLKDEFAITEAQIQALCQQYNMKMFHASAKNGDNVENIFNEIGSKLCEPIVTKHATGAA
jgi:small GTP-binding protein